MKQITLFNVDDIAKTFNVDVLTIYYNDKTCKFYDSGDIRFGSHTEAKVVFDDITLLDKLPNTNCYDRAEKLLELTGWEFLD